MSVDLTTRNESPEAFISTLFRDGIERPLLEIEHLRSNNAQAYRISIGAISTEQSQPPFRHGASALPRSSTQLVLRLSQPAAMLNENVRVQNEVAVTSLMREALSPQFSHLVPKVYGWEASSEFGENGWVLMELMPGTPLGGKFPSLDPEKQREILRQIAQIFKCIQDYKLPESVQGYGGLNFDEAGRITVGPTAIFGSKGACDSHATLYAEYFATQVGFSDKCDIVQGWKDTNSRARIDKFGAEGLRTLLQKFPARPTLVHGDFDLHNILFDEDTNRITALLDFDFGHIGSQADEYFYSFAAINSLLVPPFEDDAEVGALRAYLLRGFDGIARQEIANRPSEPINWKIATMLDEEFTRAGVQRPQDILEIEDISSIYWFMQNISPPEFFLKRYRARVSPERLRSRRDEAERCLKRYLDGWGF